MTSSIRLNVARAAAAPLDDLGGAVELDPRVRRDVGLDEDVGVAGEVSSQLVFDDMEGIHHDVEQVEGAGPARQVRDRVDPVDGA